MALELVGQFDVAVVGSGPAGMCAALSAAKTGAKVVIVESDGMLGGNLTSVVLAILGFHTNDGKQIVKGMGQEIVNRLVEAGASPGHVVSLFGEKSRLVPYDPMKMRQILMQMAQENGIELMLHSTFSDVIMDQNGVVSGLLAYHKTSRRVVLASTIIDCTGDGDVAVQAGAEYSIGRPSDAAMQPLGHSLLVGNVDIERLLAFLHDNPHHARLGSFAGGQISIAGFSEMIKDSGTYPGRDEIDLFQFPTPGTVLLNTTRIRDLSALKADEISQAEQVGTAQVAGVLEFVKSRIPGFEEAYLQFFSVRAGIRETRHIEGLYSLTAEDCVSGKRFADGIARGAYPIDIHDPDSGTVVLHHIQGDGAYDIPYRCLIPKGITNLLVAGRPISASHEAHGSLRVMATCMAIGQAAGVAAAMSIQEGCTPADLDPIKLRTQLMKDDCIV